MQAKQVRNPIRDERGMAMVIALLVILSLTILGSALMMSVNTEQKIAGYQKRDTQALSIAEAGIEEAMLHIRTGAVPDDLNPRMTALIYEQSAGSIPVAGADTTSIPTVQPAGRYLGYSTSSKELAKGSGSDLQVLTVKYKTQITPGVPPDTQIVRYDDSGSPKWNTTTGNPVFTITSYGRVGNTNRGVVAEVCRDDFNIFSRAAIAADVPIEFKGNITVCGHDHRADTPGQTDYPDCEGAPPLGWWSPGVHGNCLPGSWSTSIITDIGSSDIIGDPGGTEQNQTGFYSGPWDAIGLPQREFWPWIGASISTPPSPVDGVLYLDNNGIPQDQSAVYSFNDGTGEGFLYIDGDLQINGDFEYRGLLYIEGDMFVNGNAWVLGGVIVKGQTGVKISNGSGIILYSSDMIQQAISRFSGRLRMLTWREFQ